MMIPAGRTEVAGLAVDATRYPSSADMQSHPY